MPLPVVSFTDPRLSQPIQEAPWLTGIRTGEQLASQLQQMQQRAAMAPLQRQLTQAQIAEEPLREQIMRGQIAMQPHQQQLAHAQVLERLARAAHERALASSPYAGKILPGAAGRSQGLQILADTYGADSPIVKRAQKDYDSDMKLKLSRADYFSANTILKNLPNTVKLQKMENYYNEQAERRSQGLPTQTFKQWYTQPATEAGQVAPQVGVSAHPEISTAATQLTQTPVTTTSPTPAEQMVAGTQQMTQEVQPREAQPLTPEVTAHGVTQPMEPTQAPAQVPLTQEPFAQEARQVGVGISSKTIPTFVQQKMAFAANIQKTLEQMPESAITSYSQNPLKLANDYRKSLEGNVTKDYADYLRFISNSKVLAKQVRQFYGDSITPSTREDLERITNPISWRTSPKAALVTYNALKNTLGREIDTYIDESTDPRFFEKQRESKILRGLTPHGTMPTEPKKVGVKTKDLSKLSTQELLNMYRGGQ